MVIHVSIIRDVFDFECAIAGRETKIVLHKFS